MAGSSPTSNSPSKEVKRVKTLITTKTCISQWEYVVQELEQIVEGKRKSLDEFSYSYGRAWLEGLERGLEHALQNLEEARNHPFFIMMTNSIPVGESKTQLLYKFMDVIVEEIDAIQAEERRLDSIAAVEEVRELREKVALTVHVEPKPEIAMVQHHEPTKEVELFNPEPARHYTMMDGVRQWMAANRIFTRSLKVLDIAKYWKMV